MKLTEESLAEESLVEEPLAEGPTRPGNERHESRSDPSPAPNQTNVAPGRRQEPQVGLDGVVSEIVADALENPADYVFRSNTGVDGE